MPQCLVLEPAMARQPDQGPNVADLNFGERHPVRVVYAVFIPRYFTVQYVRYGLQYSTVWTPRRLTHPWLVQHRSLYRTLCEDVHLKAGIQTCVGVTGLRKYLQTSMRRSKASSTSSYPHSSSQSHAPDVHAPRRSLHHMQNLHTWLKLMNGCPRRDHECHATSFGIAIRWLPLPQISTTEPYTDAVFTVQYPPSLDHGW